jgi:hypothetical protein
MVVVQGRAPANRNIIGHPEIQREDTLKEARPDLNPWRIAQPGSAMIEAKHGTQELTAGQQTKSATIVEK